MSLNDPVHRHALRYATEATKVFLLDLFRRRYPDYFRFARVETRPATPSDYYVPPSLAGRCVVVERTWFEEEGCRRLSCFRVRDGRWNLCAPEDAPRWIAVGRRFEPACQDACRDHSVDAEWTDGRCVVANPYKKMLAAAHEDAFGRDLPQVVRRGFDLTGGTLALNEDYCSAYGLEFADGECVAARTLGERLFGKRTVPAVKTSARRAGSAPPPAPPPKTPGGGSGAATPPKTPPDALARLLEARGPSLKALAAELGEESGTAMTEDAVRSFLAVRAPRLLEGKTMDEPAVRLVVKHALTLGSRRRGPAGLGEKSVSATSAYEVYERTGAILEALDRHVGVLDREALRDVDERLDAEYFEGGEVRPELTPEFVWDRDVLTREYSERLMYAAERVEEYLTAAAAHPPDARDLAAASVPTDFGRAWSRLAFLGVVCVALLLALSLLERIEALATALLFARVWFDV